VQIGQGRFQAQRGIAASREGQAAQVSAYELRGRAALDQRLLRSQKHGLRQIHAHHAIAHLRERQEVLPRAAARVQHAARRRGQMAAQVSDLGGEERGIGRCRHGVRRLCAVQHVVDRDPRSLGVRCSLHGAIFALRSPHPR